MSLVLNQTRADDNQLIFLLRIAAEGNNLLSNSGFDSGANWTANADWSIGSGVATYAFVSVGAAPLYQTISAVSATEYVLEYEITAKSAGTYDLQLRGVDGDGATMVAANNITLDITLGKHSLTFPGNAGGTEFRIRAGNFGAGESISIDNVKLRLKDDPILISTRDIFLDPNQFYGNIMSWNKLSEISSAVDAESSGGIGQVTGYTFSIARDSPIARVENFFNDFYPAYNGGTIISREAQIGFVWDSGSPDYTNVTWLLRGRIIDYNTLSRSINFTVLQSSESEAKELPYYFVQKDFDNEVNYFPDAPIDNFGKEFPIVYGDLLQVDSLLPYVRRFMSTVRVGEWKYVLSSHENYDSYNPSPNNTLYEEIAEF